ncbi:hypothetical protein BU15DRAFT_64990 [Melanogaster broomeanus]|nr:hypothetical protein BU15DRAFT_64990 [Melanogaster broomeanus]
MPRHVAEEDINSGRLHMQRDDHPSSYMMTHYPRAVTRTMFNSYRGQALGANTDRLPAYALSGDSSDDIQGNSLCAQLGSFHFTTMQFNGNEYGGPEGEVNPPTAITETSLHYPTPARPSVPQYVKDIGLIAEDARLGGYSKLDGATSSIPDVALITAGRLISSPSPPPTSYDEDDWSEEDWGCGLNYCEQSPTITPGTARQTASCLPPYFHPAQSLSESQVAFPSSILPIDHRFAAATATPFPGYTSSQSPHDHPVCGSNASFTTAILGEGPPRPGSAPPLIDTQVPFVGNVRAALQFPENTATGEHLHVTQPHPWYSPAVIPYAGPSPRSSLRGAGSIGQNSITPPGSRHSRRWSSVTNPALQLSPTSAACAPRVMQFSRHPQSDMSFSYFSPPTHASTDGESEDAMPHAAAEALAEPAARSVIRCDGHLVDEESLTMALHKPDQQLHVYECFWDLANSPCGMWIEGDQSSVADHLNLFHQFKGGEVRTRCLWRDCPKNQMKGTSIARHVVTHVGFRVKCYTCKHEFARVDACNRAHSRSGCSGVGRPMYGDLERVLDARKVELVRRPSKKRRMDE